MLYDALDLVVYRLLDGKDEFIALVIALARFAKLRCRSKMVETCELSLVVPLERDMLPEDVSTAMCTELQHLLLQYRHPR